MRVETLVRQRREDRLAPVAGDEEARASAIAQRIEGGHGELAPRSDGRYVWHDQPEYVGTEDAVDILHRPLVSIGIRCVARVGRANLADDSGPIDRDDVPRVA